MIFEGDDHTVENDKFCQSVGKGILHCEQQKLGNSIAQLGPEESSVSLHTLLQSFSMYSPIDKGGRKYYQR